MMTTDKLLTPERVSSLLFDWQKGDGTGYVIGGVDGMLRQAENKDDNNTDNQPERNGETHVE